MDPKSYFLFHKLDRDRRNMERASHFLRFLQRKKQSMLKFLKAVISLSLLWGCLSTVRRAYLLGPKTFSRDSPLARTLNFLRAAAVENVPKPHFIPNCRATTHTRHIITDHLLESIVVVCWYVLLLITTSCRIVLTL